MWIGLDCAHKAYKRLKFVNVDWIVHTKHLSVLKFVNVDSIVHTKHISVLKFVNVDSIVHKKHICVLKIPILYFLFIYIQAF